MKSCSICASTIDQCVHTSIAPCDALAQPCYALPCLDPNVLRLAKPLLGVTMMPLGAPSISKYGSLVQPDAQIVALARTALKAPPMGHTPTPSRFGATFTAWGGGGWGWGGRGLATGGGGAPDPYIYGVKWLPHHTDDFEVQM